MGRLFIRLILALYVFLYRLTNGMLGSNLLVTRVLLLNTTGRKTRKTRTTPMGYIKHDRDYVIIGLFALLVNKNPGWFYNLESNPHALIQVNGQQIEVTAEMVGSDKRDQVWAWVTKLAPLYAKVAKRTSREIPLVVLHPSNM